MKHPHAPPLSERSVEPIARRVARLPEAPRYPPRCVVCRGPTLEQFVAAGYPAERYPPQGYAATTIPCCRRDD